MARLVAAARRGATCFESRGKASRSISMAADTLSTFTRNSGGITVNTDSTSFVMTNGYIHRSAKPTASYPVGINMASGPPYNAPWRIYNITFTDDSSGGTCYGFVGLGPGLYDHNTITTNTDAAETIHILGGNEGCTSCWTEDVVPGSANMPIFENDVWTESSSSNYCQGEEGNYGAVFTIRDSQLNNCQIDVHGGPPSNRWIEFYNNTFNNGCCASGAFIDWRGGSGLFYGNTVNGTPKGGTSTNLGPIGGSSDNTGSYPVAYQFGMGIDGTHYSPTYLWGSGAPQQLTNIYNRTTPRSRSAAPTLTARGCQGALLQCRCDGLTTGDFRTLRVCGRCRGWMPGELHLHALSIPASVGYLPNVPGWSGWYLRKQLNAGPCAADSDMDPSALDRFLSGCSLF